MNSNEEFLGYRMDDSVEAQLHNNLWMANLTVEKKFPGVELELYILGGAAMMFHKLNYNYTLDIDTANEIKEEVKDSLAEFAIDDASSEVAKLPKNYKSRAIRVREDLEYVRAYVLSVEDIFINKVLTKRGKDYAAIKTSGLLKVIDKARVRELVETELSEQDRLDYEVGCLSLGI